MRQTSAAVSALRRLGSVRLALLSSPVRLARGRTACVACAGRASLPFALPLVLC
jgi:hypothetical protein